MEPSRFFDWVVECEPPLPDLDGEMAWGSPDLRVRLDDREPPPPPDRPWRPTLLKRDGTPSMESLRDGDVLWLRFPGLASFRTGTEPGLLLGAPAPGVPAEVARHFAVDLVLPGLRTRAGRPVLRAAAVLAEGGAVVIAGPEGSGKSTLAAALALRGLPLVGDDMIALDASGAVSRAQGTLASLRLWPDSPLLKPLAAGNAGPVAAHTRKVRVDPAKAGLKRAPDPVPVRRILLLPPAGGAGASAPAFETLPARDAVGALVEACFLLEPGDGQPLRDRLLRAPVAPLLPLVRRLSVPRGGDRLDEVVEAILREAAS